ncbi:hypothetical protein LTR96_009447 [Exophiala xenobiotica]|nr:hypothetical protein LTR92_010346 [Exophiala xenobiotica]KAK5217176.1 hypothetical protein LTR72_009742 [Exophiala xenobiotica]KAK5265080.1 hypothetical protein LTR96_009447 [Exophiala xenobiotica]KAK5287527.1 hypothetical protein LTR14_009190 [Exophiala xenobiotica]KAK5334070.1 hypothetical protein LTR98_009982 [Exophiala xenobiotica]
MAPTTPSTVRKNKYSRQTLHISVGRSKVPFHVHYAQLESTAFFEVHGKPTSRAESRETSVVDDREPTLSPVPDIKAEDGETTVNESPTVQSPTKPAYNLEGFVYEPAAFEVVVNWLYNQPPNKPAMRNDCKTLLRAYVLALQYRITGLQDELVDCIRQYHRDFNVTFEDLTWLINRISEEPTAHIIPMMQYLIDQIAFEISTQGFTEFSRNNIMFETFLAEGVHPIRIVLFRALADVARANPHRDPAQGPNRWRVDDWVAAPTPIQNPIDIIDIDEE